MNNTLTISVNIEKIHEILSNRYVEDFGSLDDRFYFMSGFVSSALMDEIKKKNKEKDVPLGGIEYQNQ